MDKKKVEIGDVIVAYPNRKEYWGTISTIEIGANIFWLNTDRMVRKENQNIKWYAFSPEEHIKFLQNPDAYQTIKQNEKTELIWEQVAQKNQNQKVPRFIYKVYWLDDGTFKPQPYNMSAIYEMSIIAKSSEEAKDIASQTSESLSYIGEDTKHFWADHRYLVCDLIGSSYIDESQMICINKIHDIS